MKTNFIIRKIGLIIAFSALLLLVAACTKTTDTELTQIPVSGKIYGVKISSEGYSPSTLTIKKCDLDK